MDEFSHLRYTEDARALLSYVCKKSLAFFYDFFAFALIKAKNSILIFPIIKSNL